MGDPFIQSYIGDLLRSLRTSYLIDLIKPYTRLELTFLAKVRVFSLNFGSWSADRGYPQPLADAALPLSFSRHLAVHNTRYP